MLTLFIVVALIAFLFQYMSVSMGLGYLPRSPDAKVIFILAICGAIGALVGIFCAINIPKLALEIYIGVMVLAIGILILMRRRQEGALSWKRIIGKGS